ncbi:uncharacterized protein AC631_01196 [Debaryomyces fabryi]|uniref:Zn(2)-C6 fungal-type domain-containing protein n=1 Tax=Debaryomyces fabryi TaxID=58627 RepID=A0A0V1Q3X1_9ASCO|nr:uncharacterized protein AC631_01196 [Debaryomyces fabryi]KSA03062.1 hypothetical protein AC631_01196 [Debaryomyces fabryi]CUM49135.1 unnamed protein product [Debaryomyces fabryi]
MANKGGWKFRKPRGSRACTVCRLRKVRCDAETQMPCSNCISFGSDCRFPEPRRKKGSNIASNSPQPGSPSVQMDDRENHLPIVNTYGNSIQTNNYSTIGLHNTYNEGTNIPVPQSYQVQPGNQVNHLNQMHHQHILPVQVQQQAQQFTPMVQDHNMQQIRPQAQNSNHMLGMAPNQQYVAPSNQSYTAPLINQLYVPSLSIQLQGQPWLQHPANKLENINTPSYIPNDPLTNISVRNVMPQYNPSDMNTPSNNGVKVAPRRKLSKYLYLGPTSCYSYFADDWRFKGNEEKHNKNIVELGYNKSSSIDPREIITELQVLNIKGAFSLPSRPVILNIFEAFFDAIYPLIPLINKDIFMNHFNDPNPDKQPPLILIQAILLAGSKYSQHPAIVNSHNSSSAASFAFYQRVKALYDSTVKFEYVGDGDDDDGHLAFNYPTMLVQVSCLLSWHWVDPEDISRGIYFWIRNAITIAQTFGFHTNMAEAPFVQDLLHKYNNNEQQIYKIHQQIFNWKKIWWWLYCRDKSAAMSFGRPLTIDIHETSCGVPSMKDFEKYESENWSVENKRDRLLAEYFIHIIYLSEILDLVIKEQYQTRHPHNTEVAMSRNTKVVKQLNLLMGIFFKNLPSELKFTANDPKSMNAFSCLLGPLYYITLYHINRVKLITTQEDNNKYWGISFQAAYMTSLIAQYLSDRMSTGEKLMLSPLLVYTMSMAMIILSFHTDSTNRIVAQTASKQMHICLKFSKQFHASWPGVAYLLVTFFTERLNKEDKKDDMVSRAKAVLVKACEDFKSDEERGKSDHLRHLKTFDLNFMLNESDDRANPDVSDISSNGDHGYDHDDEDLSLPMHNIVTIELPPVDSDFYKAFSATQLFPKDTAKIHTISPTPTPVQSPPSSKINPQQQFHSHSGPSNVQLQPSNDANNTRPHNSVSDHQLFSEGFPGFVANSNASTTTPVHTSAASFGTENIPLYPTAPDAPMYPYPPPAQQSSSLDFQDNAVLDSQYFLNVNSGVNWNTYNI